MKGVLPLVPTNTHGWTCVDTNVGLPAARSHVLNRALLGEEVEHLPEVDKVKAFLHAVREGFDNAGK